ncbi:uncharacterized protein DS421_18g621180 [Arachis hypogaea]|nr:uncharacterized protein DS421_18g621180 [Arachis hypogaea]
MGLGANAFSCINASSIDISVSLLNEYHCLSTEYKRLTPAHVRHMLDNMQNDNSADSRPRFRATYMISMRIHTFGCHRLLLVSLSALSGVQLTGLSDNLGGDKITPENPKILGDAHNKQWDVLVVRLISSTTTTIITFAISTTTNITTTTAATTTTGTSFVTTITGNYGRMHIVITLPLIEAMAETVWDQIVGFIQDQGTSQMSNVMNPTQHPPHQQEHLAQLVQQPLRVVPGRFSFDARVYGPSSSSHLAARMSLDSSRSEWGRGICHEYNSGTSAYSPRIDLNLIDSSIQETDEENQVVSHRFGAYHDKMDSGDEDDKENEMDDDGGDEADDGDEQLQARTGGNSIIVIVA